MRIIEPKQIKRTSIKKRSLRKKFIFVILLTVLGAGVFWKTIEPKKIETNKQEVAVSTPEAQQLPDDVKLIKQFTNDEFVGLYSTFAYPNTNEIVIPPVITGNPDADTRIRKLAEDRGYKLRSAPVVAPIAYNSELYIQQKALQPLKDLVQQLANEGMQLTITAAFRSIEEQRQIFTERLTANASDIAAGTADDSVLQTLKTTAPPGYSRHHNGFTIDVACGSVGLYGFLDTPCYDWLAKDNFLRAKELGWIPSYPDGVNSVGPEPEPWEYVWVGREALLE